MSGSAASVRISAMMSSTEQSAISWMKLIFLYSPDAMRGDDSAPCHFRINDRLAAAVVDHHHKRTAVNLFIRRAA
jgi:hypothetical protein